MNTVPAALLVAGAALGAVLLGLAAPAALAAAAAAAACCGEEAGVGLSIDVMPPVQAGCRHVKVRHCHIGKPACKLSNTVALNHLDDISGSLLGSNLVQTA